MSSNPFDVRRPSSAADYLDSLGIDPLKAYEAHRRKAVTGNLDATGVVVAAPNASQAESLQVLESNNGEAPKVFLTSAYFETAGKKYCAQEFDLPPGATVRKAVVAPNLFRNDQVRRALRLPNDWQPSKPKPRSNRDVNASANKYAEGIHRGIRRHAAGRISIGAFTDTSFRSGVLNGSQHISEKIVGETHGMQAVYSHTHGGITFKGDLCATSWSDTDHAYGTFLGLDETTAPRDKKKGVHMRVTRTANFRESEWEAVHATLMVLTDPASGFNAGFVALKVPFHKLPTDELHSWEEAQKIEKVNANTIFAIKALVEWIAEQMRVLNLDPSFLVVHANLVCGPKPTDENPDTFAQYAEAFAGLGLRHESVSPTGTTGLTGSQMSAAEGVHLFVGRSVEIEERIELVPHPKPLTEADITRGRYGIPTDGSYNGCGSVFGAYGVKINYRI